MNDINGLDQTEREMLAYEVADEALESAIALRNVRL